MSATKYCSKIRHLSLCFILNYISKTNIDNFMYRYILTMFNFTKICALFYTYLHQRTRIPDIKVYYERMEIVPLTEKSKCEIYASNPQ